jgi:hypothetical protein
MFVLHHKGDSLYEKCQRYVVRARSLMLIESKNFNVIRQKHFLEKIRKPNKLKFWEQYNKGPKHDSQNRL